MNIIDKFHSRISERTKSWISFAALIAVFVLLGAVYD